MGSLPDNQPLDSTGTVQEDGTLHVGCWGTGSKKLLDLGSRCDGVRVGVREVMQVADDLASEVMNSDRGCSSRPAGEEAVGKGKMEGK